MPATFVDLTGVDTFMRWARPSGRAKFTVRLTEDRHFYCGDTPAEAIQNARLKNVKERCGMGGPGAHEEEVAAPAQSGHVKPAGTNCSVCGEPQFVTDHGLVCKNGHGGAPATEEMPNNDLF